MPVNTLFKTIIAAVLAISLFSISLSINEFSNNRSQDDRIERVEVNVDAVTKRQVALQGEQLKATRAQVARLTKITTRNRQLLLILLRLRDENPELFRNIDIPDALVREVRRPIRNVSSGGEKPTRPKPVKPTPTKPDPTPVDPVTPEPTPPVTPTTPTTPEPPVVPPVVPPVAPQPQPPITIPLPPILPLPPICVLLICTG